MKSNVNVLSLSSASCVDLFTVPEVLFESKASLDNEFLPSYSCP